MYKWSRTTCYDNFVSNVPNVNHDILKARWNEPTWSNIIHHYWMQHVSLYLNVMLSNVETCWIGLILLKIFIQHCTCNIWQLFLDIGISGWRSRVIIEHASPTLSNIARRGWLVWTGQRSALNTYRNIIYTCIYTLVGHPMHFLKEWLIKLGMITYIYIYCSFTCI